MCETCGEEMSLEHLGDPNERSFDEEASDDGGKGGPRDDEGIFF